MPMEYDCLRTAAQRVIAAWGTASGKDDMTDAIVELRAALDDPLYLLSDKFREPHPPLNDDLPIHVTAPTTMAYGRHFDGGGKRWTMEIVRTAHDDAAMLHRALVGMFQSADLDTLESIMPILGTGQRARVHSMVWFARATPICWVRMKLSRGKW